MADDELRLGGKVIRMERVPCPHGCGRSFNSGIGLSYHVRDTGEMTRAEALAEDLCPVLWDKRNRAAIEASKGRHPAGG